MASGGVASCTLCLAGKSSSVVGATTAAVCVSCVADTYQTSSGASVCVACPAGTYSEETGAVEVPCQICVPGKYAEAAGLSTCTTCPIGTFSTTHFVTSAGTCLPCPGALVSPSASSAVGSCYACAEGKYRGSSDAGRVCVDCPATTYQPGTDASQLSDCQVCPTGKFSKAGKWMFQCKG